MLARGPEEVVAAFFEAFNRADLEAAMALYEPNAILAAQSGRLAEGRAAIREALKQFLPMKPITVEKSAVVTAGDIALSVVQWSLAGTGPDGAPVRLGGATSDVLRRQADGRWLFVIDNPWGAGVSS